MNKELIAKAEEFASANGTRRRHRGVDWEKAGPYIDILVKKGVKHEAICKFLHDTLDVHVCQTALSYYIRISEAVRTIDANKTGPVV